MRPPCVGPNPTTVVFALGKAEEHKREDAKAAAYLRLSQAAAADIPARTDFKQGDTRQAESEISGATGRTAFVTVQSVPRI